MSKTLGIAYLDHSSLNDMYEGRESEIHDFLEANGLKVVFSDENLTEIRNSVIRRDYFIEQLDNLKAFHIENPLDDNWKQTNNLSVTSISASERMAIVERNDSQQLDLDNSESSDAEDGLTEILAKLHGTNSESSVVELMGEMLEQAARDADGLLDDQIAELKSSLSVFSEVDNELENNGAPFSSENIEIHIGYSASEISGITGPNAVAKLWKMVGEKFGDFSTVNAYQDHIMSLSGFQYGVDGTSKLTLIQRANDLYHWLNLIGFHKDEKIRKLPRMRGSFRDMTHAGYAMVGSTHFLCSDKRLRLKAEAIYEHMGFDLKIVDTKSFAMSPACN